MTDSIQCPDLFKHCNLQDSRRVIALGYYDGPTSGVLQCKKCFAEYYFDMIDYDERDDGNDVRIFSLFPIAAGTFQKLVEIFSKGGEPVWPVWAPKRIDGSQTIEVLDKTSHPEWIVAWQGYWGDIIIAAKRIDAQDWSDVEYSLKYKGKAFDKRDWFSFLGLERHEL